MDRVANFLLFKGVMATRGLKVQPDSLRQYEQLIDQFIAM